jgi:hypothetical protein
MDYGERCRTWFTPFYFSIVTYTTLGFGDVKPATLIGEIIVSTEVILGYTPLGPVVGCAGGKIGAPELRIFHNIRFRGVGGSSRKPRADHHCVISRP